MNTTENNRIDTISTSKEESAMTTATTDIRPVTFSVPQADLDDLNTRLSRTRFARPAPGDDWDYGTPNAYLREMVDYWRTEFDWRAHEARIADLPHFATQIDGQQVHFVHVRSAEANATPIVLTHAYPGSFVDFIDMIGPLTDPVAHGGDPEDAFDVVIPSIPGFTLGDNTTEPGWTLKRVARAWDALMRRLGYDSYGAHGSDAGALISRELAILNPTGFLGAQVLQLFSFPSGDPAEFEKLQPKDHAALDFLGWFQQRAGFAGMNASRPQTIAAALSDSPVGQLAYNELFENFGNGTTLLTKDQVLTQVSLYWFTNTSASALRFYYEDARAAAEPEVNDGRIGVSVFGDDFLSIRAFAERDNTCIEQWVEHEPGGHFAAMELPEVVTDDIRAFFRSA
jgi:hypothetical protein